MIDYLNKIKNNWSAATSEKVFLFCFIIGWMICGAIIVTQPAFYRFIEARNGTVLNDFLLNRLPAINVSVPIFIIIWGMVALGFVRSLITPHIFLNYMMGFIFVTFFRIICLSLIALDPPVGIIELKDPFTDVFYGGVFITKDLFFSGHTATLVLLSLALEKKRDKMLGLIGAVLVGLLLLVQHVHYTLDVVAAPFFTWAGFNIGQRVLATLREKYQVELVSAPVK
jgi:hypothetical protein